MTGRFFINYRRGDDPGFTQALYQKLEAEFGREALFMDVEGHIKAGDDFMTVLDRQVAQSDVLLAVIGPRWLDARDEGGQSRLDNPEDFVRIEILSALERDKRVIPVLVNNASMPRADDLPEPMKSFARRNARRITIERFSADCAGLVKDLRDLLRECERKRKAEAEAERRRAAGAARALRQMQQARGGSSSEIGDLSTAIVLGVLGAVLGAIAFGLMSTWSFAVEGRSILIAPAVGVFLLTTLGSQHLEGLPFQRSIALGGAAGIGWLLSDAVMVMSPIITADEWAGGAQGLPAVKLLVWGLVNGASLLMALSLVEPVTRDWRIWLPAIPALGIVSILFAVPEQIPMAMSGAALMGIAMFALGAALRLASDS